jgi:hypothetical protein
MRWIFLDLFTYRFIGVLQFEIRNFLNQFTKLREASLEQIPIEFMLFFLLFEKDGILKIHFKKIVDNKIIKN